MAGSVMGFKALATATVIMPPVADADEDESDEQSDEVSVTD